MSKNKRKILVNVTDLWAIWSKGKATGALLARLHSAKGNTVAILDEFAQEERDKDICDLVGYKAYTEALKDFGSDIPEYLEEFKKYDKE